MAVSNPSDQRRLPTTAPQIRQNTSLPIRAAPPRAAHTPKHKPQGHTAKGPSAAAKNHTERAPRGRKPPRNRGASRPPSSLRERASTLPGKDMSCTELSLRNLPVGVAVAIGHGAKNPARAQPVRACEAPLPACKHAAVHCATSAAVIHPQQPGAHATPSSPALQELQSKSVPAAV